MLTSEPGKKRSTMSLKLGFLLPGTFPSRLWLKGLKDTSFSNTMRDNTVQSSTAPFKSLGFGRFTWGSGPLQCMACTSPLGLMGFYLGCHLWKVASLLTLDARTILCGLQNLPHLLSI